MTDIETTLRLATDLEHRGYLISHLVSTAVRSIVLTSVVPELLASSDLKPENCDKLIKILQRYHTSAAVAFNHSMKAEYISIRNFLYDVENRTGDLSPENTKDENGNTKPIGKAVADLLGVDDDFAASANEMITAMKKNDFEREVTALNQTYKNIQKAVPLPYQARIQGIQKSDDDPTKQTKLLQHTIPSTHKAMEAYVRADTRLAATFCLIAIRRWQITNPNKPIATLQKMSAAAGLSKVPTDPFTGNAMNLTKVDDQPVVYSFGADGRDDRGMVDWDYNRKPGDVIFRLRSAD